jgi:lysophospholipase L1-like esterase
MLRFPLASLLVLQASSLLACGASSKDSPLDAGKQPLSDAGHAFDASQHEDATPPEQDADAGTPVDAGHVYDAGTDSGPPDAGHPPVLIDSYTSAGATRGNNADNGLLNIGNQFSVTQEGIVLQELGVFDLNSDGLAHDHTVTVFKLDQLGAAAKGTPVAGASITLPAGTSLPLIDGIRFMPLPAPVALEPGAYAAIVYGLDGQDTYGEGGNIPTTATGVKDEAFCTFQFVAAQSPAFPNGGVGVALPSASFRFSNGGPAPLKILPLGDSITAGCCEGEAGYRRVLQNMLDTANVLHQFVGTGKENPGTMPHDQLFHEGHSGWALEAGTSGRDGLIDHVATWLGPNGAHPDVITLMIGTNDVNIRYDLAHIEERLDHLVTMLLDKSTGLAPNARLILAQITLNGDANHESDVLTYNQSVAKVAEKHAANGESVTLVDMHSALTYPDDFHDTLHPNAQGYQKMAQVWYDALMLP